MGQLMEVIMAPPTMEIFTVRMFSCLAITITAGLTMILDDAGSAAAVPEAGFAGGIMGDFTEGELVTEVAAMADDAQTAGIL